MAQRSLPRVCSKTESLSQCCAGGEHRPLRWACVHMCVYDMHTCVCVCVCPSREEGTAWLGRSSSVNQMSPTGGGGWVKPRASPGLWDVKCIPLEGLPLKKRITKSGRRPRWECSGHASKGTHSLSSPWFVENLLHGKVCCRLCEQREGTHGGWSRPRLFREPK